MSAVARLGAEAARVRPTARRCSGAALARCSALTLWGALVLSGGPARAADPQGLDGLSATRERPLFAPSRRPPPRPAILLQGPATPVATDAPPPSLEVRGVIYGGDRRVAIVKRPQDPQTTAVKVGGQIDGWVVEEIHPRGIVLKRDGRSVSVPMPDPGR